jgi:hypothetical protein
VDTPVAPLAGLTKVGADGTVQLLWVVKLHVADHAPAPQELTARARQ